MNATCTVCHRQYAVNDHEPVGTCVSCGGKLIPDPASPANVIPPPVIPPVVQQGPIELAPDPRSAPMICPNCGKWIEQGAQICTTCGYSRRLARTLTTRVGTPEMYKPGSAPPVQSENPEIEAEKSYRRAKARSRIGRGDTLRLLIAVISLLALGATVMAAPTKWLEKIPLIMPPLFQPPKFDALNASFMMLIFLFVALPIIALGTRLAAAITNIETRDYFRWLRTAGALAACLLLTEIAFTIDQTRLHLQTPMMLPALAAVALVSLLLFTWFLQDVTFGAAILLTFAILFSAAVALIAATALFGWAANFIGIDPVIRAKNLLSL